MIAAFIPDKRLPGGVIGLQGLILFSMYVLGIVVAAVVALVLKRSLLRGAAPPLPDGAASLQVAVAAHSSCTGCSIAEWDFLHNAGTIIFAVSIVMWGALAYPRISPRELAPWRPSGSNGNESGTRPEPRATRAREEAANVGLAELANRMEGAQKRQSLLGRVGRLIEPAVEPLGWDWRIGSGVIASFPAREVVVATLGVIFDVGKDVDEPGGSQRLGAALQSATWPDSGRPLFNIPVAPLDHGLLRPLCPVRLDPGRHRPRDGKLDLASVHVPLHDGSCIHRIAYHVSGRNVAGTLKEGRSWDSACKTSRRSASSWRPPAT